MCPLFIRWLYQAPASTHILQCSPASVELTEAHPHDGYVPHEHRHALPPKLLYFL